MIKISDREKGFRRLMDPINYKEACFRFVWVKSYERMEIHTDRVIMWLGSGVGTRFLEETTELIGEYPYKETCNWIYVMGELTNKEALILHYRWFVSKFKNISYESASQKSFDNLENLYKMSLDISFD